MCRAWFVVVVEQRVQLVIERPDALRERHVLRDPSEAARMLRWAVETLGEVRGDVRQFRKRAPASSVLAVHAGAEDDHQPAGHECTNDSW